MASNRHSVPGSERSPLPGARAVGAAYLNERMEVTVMLRRAPDADGTAAKRVMSARSLQAAGASTRMPRGMPSRTRWSGMTCPEAGQAAAASVTRSPCPHGRPDHTCLRRRIQAGMWGAVSPTERS